MHRAVVNSSYLPASSTLGVTIPRQGYQSQSSGNVLMGDVQSIVFSMENGSSFAVRDALNENYSGLIQRDDAMLPIQESSSISIRIEVFATIPPNSYVTHSDPVAWLSILESPSKLFLAPHLISNLR